MKKFRKVFPLTAVLLLSACGSGGGSGGSKDSAGASHNAGASDSAEVQQFKIQAALSSNGFSHAADHLSFKSLNDFKLGLVTAGEEVLSAIPDPKVAEVKPRFRPAVMGFPNSELLSKNPNNIFSTLKVSGGIASVEVPVAGKTFKAELDEVGAKKTLQDLAQDLAKDLLTLDFQQIAELIEENKKISEEINRKIRESGKIHESEYVASERRRQIDELISRSDDMNARGQESLLESRYLQHLYQNVMKSLRFGRVVMSNIMPDQLKWKKEKSKYVTEFKPDFQWKEGILGTKFTATDGSVLVLSQQNYKEFDALHDKILGDYIEWISSFSKNPAWSKMISALGLGGREDVTPPSTLSAGVSTPSSRRGGDDGLGGVDVFGEKHAVNLPVFIKLTGDMKSDFNGSALWKVGNMMVGASHASADQLSYLKSGHQKETNFVATFMSGKAFAELQFGAMSAENAYKSNWNGTQQLAVFGYDFDKGITPFVEVSARQLKSDTADARNEVSGFAGISVDMNSTKNDFFKYDTLLTAKGGVKSFKGQSQFASSFMLEHNFKVNSGVSFKTNMSFSSEADTSFKVSVGFSQ